MSKFFCIFLMIIAHINLWSQANIVGKWDTQQDNASVNIHIFDGQLQGNIIYSENKNTTPGMKMIKDLKEENGIWKGKIYAPKRRKWYNAVFKPENQNLKITISAGILRKTIYWKRITPEKN